MKQCLSILLVSFIVVSSSFAQNGVAPKTQQVSVQDVVLMKQAGLSDDIVIAKIHQHNLPIDLSTDELIGLKKEKVSDAIIKALIDPKSQPSPSSISPGRSSHPDLPGFRTLIRPEQRRRLDREPLVIRMIRSRLTIPEYTSIPRITPGIRRW